ncbi:MAG: LysR family transcriptional regulator [Chloroflexi bacterium]|nr:LysR family transcriptional regulator [Chloroflexota bacterium]
MNHHLLPTWMRVFLAVAEHGSFNRAAEALLLTQPAVSHHMRRLEAQLGTALFERSPQGVRLTSAGETLLRYARVARWVLLAAESSIMEVDRQARHVLTLGVTPTISTHCLPKWLAAFHRHYPRVQIRVHTHTTPHLVSQVTRNELPLAIIEGELPAEETVDFWVLEHMEFLIVAPAHSPWAAHARLPLRALDGQPLVTRAPGTSTRAWLDRVLAEHGARPRIVAELDSPDAIQRAVAQGLGVALLPRCMLNPAAPGLHLIEIEGTPPVRYLKALWPKNLPLHPLARAFLETLCEGYPTLKELLAQVRQPEAQLERLQQLLHSLPVAGDAAAMWD